MNVRPGKTRHATRTRARRGSRSGERESFPFRPAQNGGHRNVVLPVHAVASRGFEIPGIKLGLKPGKCEFEMLPPDVPPAGSAFGIILCLPVSNFMRIWGKIKREFRPLEGRKAADVREIPNGRAFVKAWIATYNLPPPFSRSK